MMFRTGALKELLVLAKLYPDKVISYNHDRVNDDVRPIRIEAYAATNKLLEVETRHFLWLYSQSYLSNAMPRMLNCIVPRETFDRMRQRFGGVFGSMAPDFSFCCRCLDIEDTILFYDKSVLFHYALDRSSGASASRGEMTPDYADFVANLNADDSARYFATPIPQLITSHNAIIHEFLDHRQRTGSARFGSLEMQRYLQKNAEEVRGMTNTRWRAAMLSLLTSHGYQAVDQDLSTVPPGTVDASAVDFEHLEDAIDYARLPARGDARTTRTYHELLEGRDMPHPYRASV
jgi:hypothetical protein